MAYLFSEQICQLRHDTLLLYNKPVYDYDPSPKLRLRNLCNFKEEKTYSGKVTMHTKKRISKAINIMLQSLEKQIIFNPVTRKREVFKLNFITLTVSALQKHLSSMEAYSTLLKPFLNWLTKTKGVKTYIWKSEKTKKGQIHYHITTTTWIHWYDIRNKWNYILAKNNMLDEYIKRYGHANANSTDVHKVYKIRNLSGYLHKELCKSIQNEGDNKGKIWDCSNNLKGQKYYSVYFDAVHEKRLVSIMKKMKLTEYTGDQFTVIKGTKELSKLILTPDEREVYAKWILTIRNTPTLGF